MIPSSWPSSSLLVHHLTIIKPSLLLISGPHICMISPAQWPQPRRSCLGPRHRCWLVAIHLAPAHIAGIADIANKNVKQIYTKKQLYPIIYNLNIICMCIYIYMIYLSKSQSPSSQNSRRARLTKPNMAAGKSST